MANENVKIVIKEVNESSPQGAGASSDIVYVPGFANDIIGYEDEAKTKAIYSTKNVPVLCNSIAEFEYHFGKTPYVLEEKDVSLRVVDQINGGYKYEGTGAKNYNNYLAGSMDASYIYAKELLNAGVSVYYENISLDTEEIDAELADIAVDEKSLKDADAAVRAAEKASTNAVSKQQAADSAYQTALQMEDSDPTKEATVIAAKEALDRANATLVSAEESLNNANSAYEDVVSVLGTPEELSARKASLVAEKELGKIDYLYSVLSDRLTVLEDKDEYTVKYITSGGYPTFCDYADHTNNSLADKMVDVAYKRGDAVALVDHSNAPTLPLDPFNHRSIYYAVNKHTWSHGTFGAMFTPYGKYSCMTIADNAMTSENEGVQILPASFGYLKCLASAIKTSPNWLAMAGVARGLVPNLQELNTKQLMSNIIAEDYQPKFGSNSSNSISINAITNIKPYGLTMWGNRTLERVDPKGTTALNFLNTRNMISDIKKLAHQTAKSLMFEQDSDKLWLSFKTKMYPLLEQLKTGYGLSDYQIVKATTKYDGEPLTKGELAAVIRIFPLYAVEYFDITVVISDEES